MPKAPKTSLKVPTKASPHMIKERRMAENYRAMGAVNLFESDGGGIDLAEYEKWLKEIQENNP